MSIRNIRQSLTINCWDCASRRQRRWAARTHSHESFYHEENDAESAYWSRKGALGADMESAALFTIGRLRGMKTASILNNVVVYGEDTADAIGGYVDGESLTAIGERNEILTALEALYRLEQERVQ